MNYSVCFAVLLLYLSTIGEKVLQNANEVYCCTSTLQQMVCVVILFLFSSLRQEKRHLRSDVAR